MKKLPIDLQTFSKLINGNYAYIDKTEQIYKLIQGNCRFFARPRRFGKSLLCSTLVSLFSGEKDLFKDLWIARETDYQWPVHPVIHIDFMQIPHKTPEELDAAIKRYLIDVAVSYNLPPLAITTPNEMLGKLVKQLQEQSRNAGVVIIVDEYDRPILAHLHNIHVAKEIREILKSLYEPIKGLDGHLHFVFITGVSRFSQTSLFSGFNQSKDISMNPNFAHLAGCTETELTTVFGEHLIPMANKLKLLVPTLINKMREMYNGYRFWEDTDDDLERVYAPFSIANALDDKSFKNYWFKSGTPTFLIELIKKNHYPFMSFEHLQAGLSQLENFDIEKLPLTPLLFQTGYLTIKSYDPSTENFTLSYPNNEVKDALLQYILELMVNIEHAQINDFSSSLRNALAANDTNKFIERLKQFYALIPYDMHIPSEKYYHSMFYALLKIVGATIDAEVTTSIGRLDALIETNNHLYIIEFKLNKPAATALEQIRTRAYFQRYLDDPRQIVLIGLSFDTKVKNITDTAVELLQKKH